MRQTVNMRGKIPRWLAAMAVWCGGAGAEAQTLPGPWRPPVVCFPPTAPVFGDEIANRPPPGEEGQRLVPPPELADYVGETFYPALSTRLIDGSVSGWLRERLEAYRAERAALLNELADRLLEAEAAEEKDRAGRVRELAERQSPRIAALEQEAETLRRDLIDGGPLRRSADWSRERNWRIGETRFGHDVHAREAEFQVVRAAAYYQRELTVEQRGMLLEAAEELARRARAARPLPGPKKDDAGAMFFSPETSRLRLPAKPPALLIEKVARYNTMKVAMKRDLVVAVLRADREDWYTQRRTMQALADEQWPKLAELEALAEEIRVELAALPVAKLKAPPYVPAALVVTIEGYSKDRRELVEGFQEALRAAERGVERPRYYEWMTPEEREQARRTHETKRAAAQAEAAADFQEANAERIQSARTRYERIQAELKELAEGQVDEETGRPLEAEGLWRRYTQSIERFASFGREEVIYRGYRTAMLLPGLSREQRRLLFNAALRGLAQPLPFGEPIPTGPLPVPRS